MCLGTSWGLRGVKVLCRLGVGACSSGFNSKGLVSKASGPRLQQRVLYLGPLFSETAIYQRLWLASGFQEFLISRLLDSDLLARPVLILLATTLTKPLYQTLELETLADADPL